MNRRQFVLLSSATLCCAVVGLRAAIDSPEITEIEFFRLSEEAFSKSRSSYLLARGGIRQFLLRRIGRLDIAMLVYALPIEGKPCVECHTNFGTWVVRLDADEEPPWS